MLAALIGDYDTPNPFFGSDALWSSFQQKLNDFDNYPNNGGSSSIIVPAINRPEWEEVQDVLEGNKPISNLGCD